MKYLLLLAILATACRTSRVRTKMDTHFIARIVTCKISGNSAFIKAVAYYRRPLDRLHAYGTDTVYLLARYMGMGRPHIVVGAEYDVWYSEKAHHINNAGHPVYLSTIKRLQ